MSEREGAGAGRAEELEEGWYLMSTRDLELELRRWRSVEGDVPPSDAVRMPMRDALAYRNAGNLPDDKGRTLRLVLRAEGPKELGALSRKRLLYEPDYHDAPEWRRAGSAHVNVVPLRLQEVAGSARPWWEEPELAALEEEWRTYGTVAGIAVPGEYRGFVYKTVVALTAAGKPVTATSIADSIARWVPSEEAALIRTALLEANAGSAGSP